METIPSFAPLAARLTVHAAALRPADGARDDWAKVVALVACAVLEMLICLCEALDARAAADACSVAAPVSRDSKAVAVPAARAGCRARPDARRASRLSLAPEVHAMAPRRFDALSRTTKPTPAGPWLVWSRDPGPIRAVLAPPWRSRQETRPSRLPSSTSLSLRYRN